MRASITCWAKRPAQAVLSVKNAPPVIFEPIPMYLPDCEAKDRVRITVAAMMTMSKRKTSSPTADYAEEIADCVTAYSRVAETMVCEPPRRTAVAKSAVATGRAARAKPTAQRAAAAKQPKLTAAKPVATPSSKPAATPAMKPAAKPAAKPARAVEPAAEPPQEKGDENDSDHFEQVSLTPPTA